MTKTESTVTTEEFTFEVPTQDKVRYWIGVMSKAWENSENVLRGKIKRMGEEIDRLNRKLQDRN